MNETMIFKWLGEDNKEGLNANPVIYTSKTAITSVGYAGSVSKVDISTTFTPPLKEKLKKLDVFVSIGTTKGVYKNIHLYTKRAKYLDGRERICYLQQHGSDLLVSEYNGNRGAKYSALYGLLCEALTKKGFVLAENASFRIPFKSVDDFVDVVNTLTAAHMAHKHKLVLVREVDSVMIQNRPYYYFRCEWVLDNTENGAVPRAIRVILDMLKDETDLETLKNLQSQITNLNDALSTKIKLVTQLEAL